MTHPHLLQQNTQRTGGCFPQALFQARSPVPDLIFEDILTARTEEIRPYLENPEAIDACTPLHRVTVFLTYHCNLACRYCRTIVRSEAQQRAYPELRRAFTTAEFQALVERLAESPVRHLHFTGGEASLVRSLPEMARLAKECGVERTSITTNGTLPVRVYASLVESGIDEIRVSIDTNDPVLGEALTHRQGSWNATVSTLSALAQLRRDGYPFFLLANCVVGMHNRRRVAEIVRYLISLGPDDLKLITEIQVKDTLGNFPEAPAVIGDLHTILDGYPAEAFPLLRSKARTVFSPEAIGLSDVAATPGKPWRCYVPLTERTVDRLFYYPCSVYLREGGDPIGSINEPNEMQRLKSAAFVAQGACLEDSICKQYCLHCTKEFNLAANRLRL